MSNFITPLPPSTLASVKKTATSRQVSDFMAKWKDTLVQLVKAEAEDPSVSLPEPISAKQPKKYKNRKK